MSDHKNKTQEEQQQQIPLNVLIIAHKRSQLASAAAFLTRRGVPCTIKGNIKDGLQYISSQKVTVVFLSWNLPGANIVKTHQLITQTFKAECVVFAEKTDGKTAAEVSSLKTFETMQAPVSGPGLYMRIQKLLKVKGELVKESKPLQLPDIPIEDEEDEFINVGKVLLKSDQPGTINFQSENSDTDTMEAKTSDPSGDDLAGYLDNEEDSDVTFTQEGMKKGDLYSSKKGNSKKDGSYGSIFNNYKKPPPKELSVHNTASKKARVMSDFKPKSGSKDSNSILAQKTFEAIEISVRPAFSDYSPVEVVCKAKIFNIHTPHFRGYLIFVIPMFNEFERSVVTSIRENLDYLLKEENERLLFFEEVNIEIEQKDFLGWAEEHAEFFIQTVDYKTEIICAYYPFENAFPHLEESENNMSLINIKDLKQNAKTNVNLYIHLPKNNKFVCYMKPGELVTESHIDKFEKHKVNNLHIRNEEVMPFKQYFVSNQIKDIIKNPAEKKDAKKAG